MTQPARLGLAVTLLVAPCSAPVLAQDTVELATRVAAETCRSDIDQAIGVFLDPPPAARRDVPLERGGNHFGVRSELELEDGKVLVVEVFAPGGQLVRVAAQIRDPGGRAEVLAVTDAQCAVRDIRRLRYRADGPAGSLVRLDPASGAVIEDQPLDPEVPPLANDGPVTIAVVDSGVNYLLPEIASKLATDGQGSLVGYDFWDLDGRPFDAHPSASPFFVQRHGTRTASLIASEAPVARIAPYRYPRPDMSRMAELIGHVREHGIRIVNISMGGNDAAEWDDFLAAARAAGEVLFVVSAGNEGRDLDIRPAYPASFTLPNLLTVTSSDNGRPARGSNIGPASVDLMVPAENMIVTGFDGHATLASGSSYAAARVSALAACLLAANPGWTTAELRAALIARAKTDSVMREYVGAGEIPDPVEYARGACPAEPRAVEVVAAHTGVDAAAVADRLRLRLSIYFVQNTGWDAVRVREAVGGAAVILGQCGIAVETGSLFELAGPARAAYLSDPTAMEMAAAVAAPGAAVFFLKDSLRSQGFGAEAIGRQNSRGRPALKDTVWITAAGRDHGISLAHELVHVLADSGEHSNEQQNLMRDQTTADNTVLSPAQCARIRDTGLVNGLLEGQD